MPLRPSALACGAAVLLLAGCAPRPAPGEGGGLSPMAPDRRERTLEAEARMDALDRRMQAIDDLPGDRRLEAQRALGPELADTAEAVAGTRFENKAWYLLAAWRYNFNPAGEGTEQALDRLAACRTSALKTTGRTLRIQLLLRQGRLVQARAQAEQLAAEVPEWRTLLALVAFYERIGAPAPATTGMSADRGAVEVLADAPGSWRLLLFGAAVDDAAVSQARRYLAAAPAGVRVYGLAADSGERIVALRQPEVPGMTLLWADSQERLDAWRRDWGLPGSAATVLVDPAGRIAAVQFGPEEFAALVR